MTIYDEVLYDYQRDAVDKIAQREIGLLADQPGLGKTLEVLATLERWGHFENPYDITLVLSPLVAADSAWKRSVEDFVQSRYDVDIINLAQGSTAKKIKTLSEALAKETDRPAVIIANHDVVSRSKDGLRIPELFELNLSAIVIDESHMVLPIANDRKLTNFWQGLLRLNYVPHRIAVSGTPDRGKLENRYGTYKFLMPSAYAHINRWQWLENNFHMYDKRVSRTRTIRAIGSMKHPSNWAREEDDVIVRRTKNEVLKQLPPKQYNYIELELHKEQYDMYKEQLVEAVHTAEDAKDNNQVSAAMMTFALRGRQMAGCTWVDDGKTWQPVRHGKSAKLDWILEWLSERDYKGDKLSGQVVISSQFTKVLNWLKDELAHNGYHAEVLSGATSTQGRIDIQRRFQDMNDDLKIVLLSGKMGVGIDLDMADDLIMFDMPYDPDVIEQVEDRIHRASNMHRVTIWNLIGIRTIEQTVAHTVSKRYRETRKTLDGRRGIDFERQVLQKLRITMSAGADKLPLKETV